MGKDSKVSREKKNLSSNSRTLHRTIPNKETITKPSQKSWGWHATQALDWAAKTIFGATVLTVISKIPGAVATALPNLSNLQYSHQRTDARSSALMRRALPICNNASTQISQWFPGGSQPFFATVNGSMVTAASGSISGSAYQRIGVNSFNVNNIPLLLNDLAVDANTWSADRPFIIATEGGPVFLYETVAAATQCYVVPYTNSLVAAGSIQTLPSSIFYNHRNPRGAALNGGGFCGTFETNDIVGGTNYQIAIRFFGRDNFTPINPAETRVSTNGTTINKNSWVGVNPDNSGTVVWQEQIGTTNHIAFNSFNSTFAFSNEGTATDNTLKSYDCVNPKLIQVPNGQWKLVFLGSPTVGTSTYNFYIQNVTLFPTFQLMGKPVNVTANQSVTFYQGADYGVMPTENNGLRIAVSTFPPASGLRAFVINVNSDNTINGGINAVDPNATTQSGMTITGFDDGSYTIGYQCNTNICYQTYSIKPNLNTPNTIPVNEAAIGQVINIPGFSVQQTTYSRGQLSVTLTISPSIMVLSTTTPTPPNATVTYDSNTGALTFVTNGVGNCQTDMNNLLCGLQGAVQAYERQSGNLQFIANDDSGLMADTGSVFVNVTTTNYTPTINVASLFTGQGARVRFNLNITAPDGATADNIQIYINNLNPAAASVNQINPATGQIIQADITEFTLQQHLTGQIVQDQSGVNQDPNFKVAVSSYNGPQSAWFDVSTRFFPTPNMITRQITYDATSANDQTPLPLSNQNFDTLSNNVPQAVVYTLYYGNDPHAGIYRIGDFQNHITGFTQADADNATNPVLYFIPDGTGKKPDIWVSVSDGYNTLPKVPIDMVLNIAPDVKIKSSLPAWAGYVPGGTIGFATLTYFGLDYRRHYLNSFANMIRHATSMGHSKLGYRLFDSTEGDKFCELIDALMTASGMKGDIDFQMKQYNYFSYRAWVPYVEYPPEKKLKRMAKAFANILERHMVKGEICGLELYYSVKGHPINKALIKRDREEKAKENQSNQIKLIGTAIANEYARIKDLPDEACCASIANCFSWKNNKDDNGIVFTSNNRPQSEKELERMQSFSGSGSGSAVSTVKL